MIELYVISEREISDSLLALGVFVSAAQNPHVDDVITETSTSSVGDKLDVGGGGHPSVPPTLPLRDHVTNYDHYLYTVRGCRPSRWKNEN